MIFEETTSSAILRNTKVSLHSYIHFESKTHMIAHLTAYYSGFILTPVSTENIGSVLSVEI